MEDTDSDPSPCINERLNKLLDFTPAARDSANIRAKCKAFWDLVDSTPYLHDMMDETDNAVECVNVCRNPTIPVDHPWLRTFYEMKQKGMDKVALTNISGCKFCDTESSEGKLTPSMPKDQLHELPVECRSDLFIIDPYRVDRIIKTPKIMEPNMYIDQWAIRQEAKKWNKNSGV